MQGFVVSLVMPVVDNSENTWDIFPFSSQEKSEIIKQLGFNSNSSCLCSDKIYGSRLEDLPCLELTSSLENIPNLHGFDPENNILTEVNFEYYTSHKFHSSEVIKDITEENYFSVIHSNVRSIATNYDNLIALITELNFNFHLIGISETKINIDKDCVSNISILGYNFFFTAFTTQCRRSRLLH